MRRARERRHVPAAVGVLPARGLQGVQTNVQPLPFHCHQSTVQSVWLARGRRQRFFAIHVGVGRRGALISLRFLPCGRGGVLICTPLPHGLPASTGGPSPCDTQQHPAPLHVGGGDRQPRRVGGGGPDPLAAGALWGGHWASPVVGRSVRAAAKASTKYVSRPRVRAGGAVGLGAAAHPRGAPLFATSCLSSAGARS